MFPARATYAVDSSGNITGLAGAGRSLGNNPGLNVIASGDSIIGRNYRTASADTTQGVYHSRGYIVVAAMLAAGRVNILGIGDHSGGAVTASLNGNSALGAYLATDVLPFANTVDCVIFGGGINDITTVGVTDAVLIAALRTIYSTLRGYGIPHIIIPTITFTTGMTNANIAQANRINDFIRAECRLYPQMICCDIASTINAAQTGVPASGMTTDGTHPSPRGAIYMAYPLKRIFDLIAPATDSTMSGNPFDTLTYSANPLAQGANASGTNNWNDVGTATGTGPASWTGRGVGTATATFTGSGTYPQNYPRQGNALGFAFVAGAANDSLMIYPCRSAGSFGTVQFNATWGAAAAKNFGQLINPSTGNNGFIYKCITYPGGTTAGSQPTWPTTVGQTVTDNDLTWLCCENLSAGDYVQFEADFLLSASTARLMANLDVTFYTSGFAGLNCNTLNFGSPIAIANSGVVQSPQYVASDAQYDAATPQNLPLNQVMRLTTPIMQVPSTFAHIAPAFRLWGENGATATGQLLRAELKKIKTW